MRNFLMYILLFMFTNEEYLNAQDTALLRDATGVGLKTLNQQDEFTPWKKIYSVTKVGTDNSHYIYYRIQVCKHFRNSGSQLHDSKLEIKFPGEGADSDIINGVIFISGIKHTQIDGTSTNSKETINDFYSVKKSDDVFSDIIVIPFYEITDVKARIFDIHLKSSPDGTNTKELNKKHRTAVIGDRG